MKKIFESKKSRLILSIVVIALIVVFLRNFDIPNFIKSINPQKGDFIKVGKMSNPRYNHEAILLDDGTVLVLDSKIGMRPAEIYNPKTKKFRTIKSMSDIRQDYSATKLNNGEILITGGRRSNKSLKSTQIYNPETENFEKGPDMNFYREGHTATLLKNGKVLIVGGQGGCDKSEIFNPLTNKFDIAAKMNTPRFKHSAILLNDGRVLIVGGIGKGGILSSAEIYTPKTNKFELAGDINIARVIPNVYILKNGNVLITGGIESRDRNKGISSIFVRDIELYNPKTNEFKIIAKRNSLPNMPTEVLLKNDTILFTGSCTGVGLSLICYKSSETFNLESKEFVKGKDMNYQRSGHKATLLKNGNVLITGSEGIGKTAELYIYNDKK